MSLQIYEEYGFKFFPCKADKSPATNGDWKKPENHISREKAENIQRTGGMIGAWIPQGILVIDLDRHKGKRSGPQAFNELIGRYNVNLNINDTLAVRTAGGGIHLFFKTENEYRQNTKEESIDLRTHKGYVIAAGSPGYTIEWDAEIMSLPEGLEIWLDSCEQELEKKGRNKDIEKNGYDTDSNEGTGTEQPANKKLSVGKLKKILSKVDARNFRSNDKWISFIFSVVATCGESDEVYEALTEWSATDPQYNAEQRNVARRIKATSETGGITAGTFIHFLREQGLSEAIVNRVLKTITVSEVLNIAEQKENSLPFNEPDYYELAKIEALRQFYQFPGANTAAATVLEEALKDQVIFVEAENKAFYFDGNKWSELYDIYSVIYTVLYRALKIFYMEQSEGEADQENFLKCLRSLNDRHFKEQTWKEFRTRASIYHEFVDWDAPEIMETMTCIDGVIEFTRQGGYIKRVRQGLPAEYRRTFIDCKTSEIMNSPRPERFIQFLSEIFTDSKTFEMARLLLGLSISGNASKRLFQLWNGGGRNGKTVLIETMQEVLGPDKQYKYKMDLILEQKFAKEDYDLIGFRGKYFCHGSEIGKFQKLNVERIKELTGYDTITARQIYEKRQAFRPTWQLVFISNDLPEFNSDFAMNDRIMILPFRMRFYRDEAERVKFIEQDRHPVEWVKPATESSDLKPQLLQERHAILNFLIDEYIRLQTDYKGVIPVSPESEIKKQKYVNDNDETGIFIREFCKVDPDNENLFVTTEAIADSYRDFIGKGKLSDRVIIKEIMECDNRIVKTSRMVEHEEYSKEYGTMVKRKKQKRGLKYIGLLSDEGAGQSADAGSGGAPVYDPEAHKAFQERDEGVDIPF